ncbi:caveolin-2 isoform X2 [Betta splendens]|uniref:Caveolin n=1 Tax=Betta splendens TaxID=158456 RepID=A0A6P7MN07_BETSP|nr:caveolin-2 isoform X2 [Betta splendens]
MRWLCDTQLWLRTQTQCMMSRLHSYDITSGCSEASVRAASSAVRRPLCSAWSLTPSYVRVDTMMKGEDSDEVEIDLRDSSDSEEFDGEEPETLWRAPPALEEEDNIHTTSLVEISDTKPLINARDPRGINDCLKVTFEDVIAEPASVRSGDRVWIWSHALFEVSRAWIYRAVAALLAVPVAALSGLLFALLSCFHIWMVGPCARCALIGTRWLQSLWSVVLGLLVRPFLQSAGRCCGGFSIHLAKE